MANPNTYEVSELDAIVDNVRKIFRDKLSVDPDFFGHDKGVKARISATLDKNAPKGTLAVPKGIDADSTAGIMRAVDLTILDHKATEKAVEDVARRAAKEHCATVCVYPEHVPIVSRIMKEEGVTDVPPIAVVGFPFVAGPTAEVTAQTVQQTCDAIADGAKEIDMVLAQDFRENKGNYQDHFKYIKAVVDAAHEKNIPVKVILETAYLSDQQIAKASVLSKIAGADWVKTSTGFAEADKFAKDKGPEEKGAVPHVVALMRRTVGDSSLDDNGNEKPMGVKQSGGLRTRDQVVAGYRAGADRTGASGGLDVRTEAEKIKGGQSSSVEPKAAGGRGY